MSAPYLLECNGVTKKYGGLLAVSKVDLTLSEGRTLAIVGPNGAGKTTLFELIAGASPLTAGRITFAGSNIDGMSPDEICREGVARTFQTASVFPTLTVMQHVLIAATFGRGHRQLLLEYPAAARTHAIDALVRCELLNVAGALAGRLPVFAKKRLMLATALASGCRLLLLDEPFGGLNPGERARLMTLVRSLIDSRVTVLFIEHLMSVVHELADTVIVLHHGVKIMEGSPADVLKDQRVLDVYVGEKRKTS